MNALHESGVGTPAGKAAVDRPGRPGRDDGRQDREPVIEVAAEILARFGARVLDPSTAVRIADQPRPRSTVYLADTLLIRGSAPQSARDALTEAAAGLGLVLDVSSRRAERIGRVRDSARRLGGDGAASRVVEKVRLRPAPGRAVVPDAWPVLQAYRAAGGPSGLVALDHLLTANRMVRPRPIDPTTGDVGPSVASYGQPGWGGRQPVTWLGAAPQRTSVPYRRPVVAVLDTGVGEHDWFPFPATPEPDSGIVRNIELDGLALGLEEKPGRAITGPWEDELEGTLDPYAGHGTFIAGLVRQQAVDADILSIRVMPTEGAVPEHVLLEALERLALRQQRALDGGDAARDELVDVVSLSLGYYHEDPQDASLDAMLLAPIEALGELGVTVVVAAGNDATSRPMYPAAFAPHAGGPVPSLAPDRVPVLSVGAENPDGTNALFSNAGAWVTATAPGAALVSTYPRIDAGGQPTTLFWASGGWRASIDPDAFASGFAVWSGTSFAAPVVAGRIAAELCRAGNDATTRDELVAQAWDAITATLPTVVRPPVGSP